VEYQNTGDTSNNRSIQKIPEQLTATARSQGTKKAVTLRTAHIVREVLVYEYETFNMGSNITCAINCNYRYLQRYLRNMVCFRNTIVNVNRDSVVVIATRYGLDGPGIESRCWRDFPHPFRPSLGSTHPPVQSIGSGSVSRGKAAGSWR